MEKMLGPVHGYYVAMFARELDGKFRASYKVCEIAPADYRSACPVRHARVDGTWKTAAQAFGMAEQLARLQIARLLDESEAGTTSPQEPAGPMYAPTEPSPLYDFRTD